MYRHHAGLDADRAGTASGAPSIFRDRRAARRRQDDLGQHDHAGGARSSGCGRWLVRETAKKGKRRKESEERKAKKGKRRKESEERKAKKGKRRKESEERKAKKGKRRK